MRVRKIFTVILLFVSWGVFFFIHHLTLMACLTPIADPFDSDLWYFYPMVAASGIIQLLLLSICKKQKHLWVLFLFCFALYCISCFGSLILLLISRDSYVWPLFCLSILIDVAGAFLTCRLFFRLHSTGDGSPS